MVHDVHDATASRTPFMERQHEGFPHDTRFCVTKSQNWERAIYLSQNIVYTWFQGCLMFLLAGVILFELETSIILQTWCVRLLPTNCQVKGRHIPQSIHLLNSENGRLGWGRQVSCCRTRSGELKLVCWNSWVLKQGRIYKIYIH